MNYITMRVCYTGFGFKRYMSRILYQNSCQIWPVHLQWEQQAAGEPSFSYIGSTKIAVTKQNINVTKLCMQFSQVCKITIYVNH